MKECVWCEAGVMHAPALCENIDEPTLDVIEAIDIQSVEDARESDIVEQLPCYVRDFLQFHGTM